MHAPDLHPKLIHWLIGLAVVQNQLTVQLRGRRHDNAKSLMLRGVQFRCFNSVRRARRIGDNASCIRAACNNAHVISDANEVP